MNDRWTEALRRADEHGGHSMHECGHLLALCFLCAAPLVGDEDGTGRVVAVTGLASLLPVRTLRDRRRPPTNHISRSMNSREEMAATLYDIRIQSGLDQSAFAARLDVHLHILSSWERAGITVDRLPDYILRRALPDSYRRLPLRPAEGAIVTLHHPTTWEWWAVCGPIAYSVSQDQLTPHLEPITRLILDRTPIWHPTPPEMGPAIATYTVEHKKHVLVLHLQNAPAPAPVNEPEMDWDSQNRTGKWKAISLYGARSTHRGTGE